MRIDFEVNDEIIIVIVLVCIINISVALLSSKNTYFKSSLSSIVSRLIQGISKENRIKVICLVREFVLYVPGLYVNMNWYHRGRRILLKYFHQDDILNNIIYILNLILTN